MTPKGAPSGAEKRQTRRRPILETFALFVVVNKKGSHRLPVNDASEHGLGFTVDLEGEPREESPISVGDTMEVSLYLNRSLHIPMSLEVVRVDAAGPVRKIGARFTDRESQAYAAYASFLKMLDGIMEVAKIG